MFDLKDLISKVRPILGGNDGLASLAFSKNGRLYSYYKNVLLSTEVPKDFPEFVVKADALVKAASNKAKISVSDTRLTITSGKLRQWLPLDNESLLPEPVPTTDFVQVPEGLITVLKEMIKFVPNEAPRIWSTSLLLKGQFAYATDGEYMIRQKLDVQLPFTCALPKALITVLAKLNKPMNTMAFNGNVLYVTFSDGSRLSSPVYAEEWPDVTNFFVAQDMAPVEPELLEFLSQVAPHAEGGVRLDLEPPNTASFLAKDGEAEATFDKPWIKMRFQASLESMVKFVGADAQIAFTERFAVVKYETRTIVIAAKAR